MRTIEYRGYFINASQVDEHTVECIISRDADMTDLVDTFSIVAVDINSDELEKRVQMYIDDVI